MRVFLVTISVLFGLMTIPAYSAALEARIDISQQKMRIYKNGKLKHTWTISSGLKGFATPTGNYRPTRMYREYYSKKYNNSPMPHSIFFRGGYAIHGTNAIKNLGRPASKGCVRLHPDNARLLYNMVKKNGSNASIKIVY